MDAIFGGGTASRLLIGMAAATAIAACGGGTTGANKERATVLSNSPAAIGNVKIVKSGFAQSDDYIWIGALLTNESANSVDVIVKFVFKDANGNTVPEADSFEASSERFTPLGQTILVATNAILPAGVNVASVEASVAEVSPAPASPAAEWPELTIGPVENLEQDSLGDFTGTVEITNPSPSPLEGVRVGVVCLDGGGGIIGGNLLLEEVNLRPAGMTRFFARDITTSGTPAKCEAYLAGPLEE